MIFDPLFDLLSSSLAALLIKGYSRGLVETAECVVVIHIRRIVHVDEISSFLCLKERFRGKLGE